MSDAVQHLLNPVMKKTTPQNKYVFLGRLGLNTEEVSDADRLVSKYLLTYSIAHDSFCGKGNLE